MDEHPDKNRDKTTERRRHTVAEREGVVKEFRASGQTQDRFAAEHGLNVATLRSWIYRPAKGDNRAGGFAPVQVVGPRSLRSPGAITVRWPQGVEVELAVDLDGSGVTRLVRELLAPCLR